MKKRRYKFIVLAALSWTIIGLACNPSQSVASDPEYPNTVPPADDPAEPIFEDEIMAAPDSEEVVIDARVADYDPDGLLPGPGRGFEVLDDPIMIPAEAATWLDPDEIVLGVEWAGEARAYPISQMAYHHIVNDAVQGNPLLVTY